MTSIRYAFAHHLPLPDLPLPDLPLPDLPLLALRLLAALLFMGFGIYGGVAMAAPAPAPAAASADQLKGMIGTLKDDAARQKLIDQLQTLLAAQQPANAPPTRQQTIVTAVTDEVHRFSDELKDVSNAALDTASITAWFQRQVDNPVARREWLRLAGEIVIVLGLAFLAEWGVRRLMIRRITAHPRQQAAAHSRLVGAILRLALGSLPIIAFAAVPAIILPFTQPDFVTLQIILAMINAVVLARLVMIFTWIAVLPGPPFRPLIDVEPHLARQIFNWSRLLSSTVIYGIALYMCANWVGVPPNIANLLLKLVGLILCIETVVVVVRARKPVARQIRGIRGDTPLTPGQIIEGQPTAGRRIPVQAMRNGLADVWHILAILYVVAVLIFSLLDIRGGLLFALRATAISLVAGVVGQTIIATARATLRPGQILPDRLRHYYPGLQQRAAWYVPVTLLILGVVVRLAVLLTVLWAWGLDSFAWLGSALGRDLIGRLTTVLMVVAVALVVWEVASAAIERYLAATDPDGKPLRRSARAQTLLPLLRNAVMIAVLIIAVMTALSTLGLNIAPLLAGAGVVGVAVGFGSQALVKDLITGLFMLAENTIAVGDSVELAGGPSGRIEAISMRTMRIRDELGGLHTIPFSSVTSVNNRSRGYGVYTVEIGIGEGEDIDRVWQILREAGEELKKDERYSAAMLEPLDVQGVVAVKDTGYVIRVRLKTLPARQWSIGRALNLRLLEALRKNGVKLVAA